MYAAAWNYQVAESKFTAATEAKPAHIELQDPKGVSNKWRAVYEANDGLEKDIFADIQAYGKAIAPAKAQLKKEINSKWIPQAEKINRMDVKIFEEVVDFDKALLKKKAHAIKGHMKHATSGLKKPQFVHPYQASLLSVEGQQSLSTNEQIAYGSVFLMAMIAVAALSNKGKAESKSVEFDVEDLEITNKKESKKQIKKTLKDIMKTSNTKVTLMNN